MGIGQPTTRMKALAAKFGLHGQACQVLARSIAKKIGVPYYEDRLTEHFRGYRVKNASGDTTERLILDKPLYRLKGYPEDGIEPGPTLEAWPMDPQTGLPSAMDKVESLTEEVWGRDYWPNTADDAKNALAKLPDNKIEGIYYHGPSMCNVLLHPGGLKVGIRAASIIDPMLGPDKLGVIALNNLKKA